MRQFWDNQYQNLFLWVPLILAFGAALYFTISIEPPIVPAILGCMAAPVMIFMRRLPIGVRAAGLFIFGFCYACLFTHVIATPGITRTLRGISITGQIEKIDYAPDKIRAFISVPASQINKNLSDAVSAHIRLSLDNDTPIHIGDTVAGTVTLFRPSPAYAPETFDYARWAYFNNLSATGYANDLRVISPGPERGINTLRDQIHHKAQSFLVDGLVLGYKSPIPDPERQTWTAAGIAHVWSISGFHMTLVGGWMFALFYFIFRAIAPLTRRIPARIPAMICAWMVLTLYLFLSGVGVATIRAFLMTTLVFAAFILGRDAVRLRNVALAFCLIFFINPHYVMQAGFQLSFAAIYGLVWFFGPVPYSHRSWVGRLGRIVRGAIMTAVIATLWTTPFVMAHFYSVPLYSLLGNLILLPLFSLAIMPLVMLGTITAMAGYMAPLAAADWVYDLALGGAQWIAGLPHATLLTPHIPNISLCLMIIGLACVMFISPRRPWENYSIGAVFLGVAFFWVWLQPRPLFFASPDNELVAFSTNDTLVFNKSRASNHMFAFDTWRQINFEAPSAPRTRRRCPGGVCLYQTPKWTLAYVQKYVPLQKNIAALCRNPDIDYIVSYFQIQAPHCAHKIQPGGAIIYPSGHVVRAPHSRLWHNPRS